MKKGNHHNRLDRLAEQMRELEAGNGHNGAFRLWLEMNRDNVPGGYELTEEELTQAVFEIDRESGRTEAKTALEWREEIINRAFKPFRWTTLNKGAKQ